MRRAPGFTVIEVLLSLLLIGSLVALSLPVYETFTRRNDLGLNTETLVNTLRRAELYARAAKYSAAWGVHIASNTIYLYQGASFASRNSAYDETSSIAGSITTSGLSDVSFARFSGAPSTTGTFTLTSTTSSARNVTINTKGMVDYD